MDKQELKNEKLNTDEESNQKKLPYPKSVFFIVSNEFCERFSFYGMRTVLVIYLTKILFFSDADAKIIYHTFAMLVYFFPVFGAIISDSVLGKFNTILYVSMIYACGSILLALTSTDPIGLPKKEFSIIGLLLIAIGSGGIKPCVAAFGGDQFILPQQAAQIATFFSLYYFSINAGSLISTFLTPVLRNDVHCFGNDSCFPLAFAVPGVLMVISIVVFAAGRPLYKIKKPEGNVVVDVSKCIGHAISRKFKSKGEKREHWLDYSEDKYGSQLVNDIKATLHVLVLYLPLPIFWALYDQQGSGWTLMAVRMDGNIGFYTILPDQMQVVNPLLILSFIPLFTYGVYPLFAKFNLLKTPLQKMVCGGFLAALAFAVSALVCIALEKADPVLPSSGNIQLRLYNPNNYAYNVSSTSNSLIFEKTISPEKRYEVYKDINYKGSENIEFMFEYSDTKKLYPFLIEESNAYGILLQNDSPVIFKDDVSKSESGYPIVRTLSYSDHNITYKKGKREINVNTKNVSTIELDEPGDWSIEVDGLSEKTINFKLGGTYTVLISVDSTILDIVITEPNSVHILWLLPQYFIITAAEIMFSVTGLEFSYSQAPVTMKSLLQACFLLTTAMGNLIIVIIESAKIFDKQSNDFFLYTGLMVVDMLLFTFMAMRYKYVKKPSEDESVEETIPEEKKEKNGIDNPTFVES